MKDHGRKADRRAVGKRSLTKMTDQMARTEWEIVRLMSTTGAEEETVGYEKFELGAVMI
jgi:hypothetical protein